MKQKVSTGQRRLIELFEALDHKALREFFRKNKGQLALKAHLKLDNIPKDGHQLAMLAAKVPAWLHKELAELAGRTSINLPDLEQAISTLQIAEEIPNVTSDSEIRSCRIAVLHEYLSGGPNAAVVEFLQPTDKSSTSFKNETPSPTVEIVQPINETEETSAAVAVVSTEAGISKKDDTPQDTSIDDVNEELDEVVARWKDNHPQFAEVVGLRRKDQWVSLADVNRRRTLFPQTGDLFIANPKDQTNEYSCWKVRRNEAGGAHRSEFRGLQEMGPVYRIVPINASSSQVDEVREQIQQIGDSATLSWTLFQLADGLVIRIKSGTILLKSDFAESLDAWTTLPIISLQYRDIALSPLPRPNTKYDLADIAVIARKVLVQGQSAEHFPKFTKSAVGEISKWLKDNPDTSVVGGRLDQVIAKFHRIAEQKDLFDEFSDRLMKIEPVQREIERRIHDAEVKLSADKSKIAGEVEDLRRIREQLKKQIETDLTRANEASVKITKVAKRAFEKAVKDGEVTLGESAVLAALLGRNASLANGGEVRPESQEANVGALAPVSSEAVKNDIEKIDAIPAGAPTLTEAIARLGPKRQVATAIAEALSIAKTVGAVVAFTGYASSLAAEIVSKYFSIRKGAMVRVRPGMLDSTELTQVLGQISDWDSICLLRANTSAFELYADRLESLVWARVLGQTASDGPFVVLSYVDSPSALPISASVRCLTFLLNLDSVDYEPDMALTADSWSESTLDALKGVAANGPVVTRAINLLGKAIPSGASAEALTLLRNALVASLTAH